MAIHIISDLHLSLFPGADKPMDIFGPRWFSHAQRLEQCWRDSVAEEDTVIVPGDISWALKLEDAKYDLDFLAGLPGKKVLLKGNHDLWWTGITKLNRMYENITFLQNDCYEAEGFYICGSRGWLTPDSDEFTEADEKIYRRELLRLESSLKAATKAYRDSGHAEEDINHVEADGNRDEEDGPCPLIGIMHYPPVADARRFSGFQQLFEDYSVKDVYYGHIHGEDGFRTCIQGMHHGINYHLVSLDYLNCQPLQIR